MNDMRCVKFQQIRSRKVLHTILVAMCVPRNDRREELVERSEEELQEEMEMEELQEMEEMLSRLKERIQRLHPELKAKYQVELEDIEDRLGEIRGNLGMMGRWRGILDSQ